MLARAALPTGAGSAMTSDSAPKQQKSERKPPGRRADYRYFVPITTRWMDNDLYGHVNNVVYFSYIDTAVNRYLIEKGGLDIHKGPVIGITAESFCRYHREITYPEEVAAGVRVGHLGSSSVRWEVGLFGGEDAARAEGHFVHVFVDRITMKPVAMPPPIRAALEAIRV